MIKVRKLSLLVLICSMLVLAACGSKPETHASQKHAANGDLQETTVNVSTLPSFLDNKPDILRQAYEIAAENAELLEWIPCYCGCGRSAGHKNNKNCFVKEIQGDGSVVWDDHGTRCNVCVETAVISAKLKAEGKSDLEIRQLIDEKYKTGYAKPTDTKMPI